MSVATPTSRHDLGRLTVEQARESRRKIEIECSQKQEELRELVAVRCVAQSCFSFMQFLARMLALLIQNILVRYKDFIEAADTIANMGGKAGEILKTASTLGELSGKLVSVTCDVESTGNVESTDHASKARDIFEIINASEQVSCSQISSVTYF